MSISPLPWSGARELERWYGLNIKLYRNRKIDSLLGWTLSKILIIPKKGSNKSFSASNFGQKSLWEHNVYLPPRMELGGLKDDVV